MRISGIIHACGRIIGCMFVNLQKFQHPAVNQTAVKTFIAQQHRSIRYIPVEHRFVSVFHPRLRTWCRINVWHLFHRMLLCIFSDTRKHCIQICITVFVEYQKPAAPCYRCNVHMTVHKRRNNHLPVHVNSLDMCRSNIFHILICTYCKDLIPTYPHSICPFCIILCSPDFCMI